MNELKRTLEISTIIGLHLWIRLFTPLSSQCCAAVSVIHSNNNHNLERDEKQASQTLSRQLNFNYQIIVTDNLLSSSDVGVSGLQFYLIDF